MTNFDDVLHQDTTEPFNQYQQWALSKMNGQAVNAIPNGELINASLGLTGEAGEFADMAKKVIFHGHPITPELRMKMALELGDALWYIAIAADSIGFSLAFIADKNQEKLDRRYPYGFEEQRSQDPNRDAPDVAEETKRKLNRISKQIDRNLGDE